MNLLTRTRSRNPTALLAAACCLMGWIGLSRSATAAEPAAASVRWEPFLSREAARLDSAFLAGVTNRSQWEAFRAPLRQEYLEMLGLWPLPERTPLQATVTRTQERPEGFRIENVHFQSRPGLYVTGNLYLPTNAAPGAQLPGILYVCGHSGRGRDGNKTAFQHHGAWFARNGYACLIIDTLQLGEIGAVHHGTYRYDRWWWQARGYTPAAVECWNGMRALDYLQSRPEVDPNRLGLTGISGGGAATFWIAAADDRVKVAVPVSGMSDLQDYVGGKVVNGHCDCMFLLNTFQWPWAQIAALVAPRPLLFANSGHDSIFPMTGNERLRVQLEKLYGFYTNRTEHLFDIAVSPGGHEDKPDLRLMAYRWFNIHLKGTNPPVTEPDIPPLPGMALRAFPEILPADEQNTRIDESFVAASDRHLPASENEWPRWRSGKLAELRRLAFRSVPAHSPGRERWGPGLESALQAGVAARGRLETEPDWDVEWHYVPGPMTAGTRSPLFLVPLEEGESLDSAPSWTTRVIGPASVLLVASRAAGPLASADPAPHYIRRSLPLLGRTWDTGRLNDLVVTARQVLAAKDHRHSALHLAGRGQGAIIAAYAALLEPRIAQLVLLDPTSSHRDGPFFPNILRVLDVPEALGLLAPRPLTLHARDAQPFAPTSTLYQMGRGRLLLEPTP